MTVSVHIVTWNSRAVIQELLYSLEKQTLRPERILVVDNASEDGTREVLRQWPTVHVLQNTRNLGFSRAHNQALKLSPCDAVFVLNPDVILEPDCLKELVKTLDSDAQFGSVSPRVLKYTIGDDELREPLVSGIIDAAGMLVRRSRQALNQGEGKHDGPKFDVPMDVFGAPGGYAVYRRAALDDVAINGEYFDETFFAYKEDVDLAWRLQWAGWRSRYVPSARASHLRTLRHHGDHFQQVVRERANRSVVLRRLSYRNHLLMLMKNESARTFFTSLPWILWYEFRRTCYMVFREWSTIRGGWQTLHLFPRMRMKHRIVRKNRRRTSKEMLSLFSP